jgi:hypothetical protein
MHLAHGLCRGNQPLVASDPSTSLHWQVGPVQWHAGNLDCVMQANTTALLLPAYP